MNLLLSVAWVTQASDFLTQNWPKLLGIFGGTGGALAIIILIAKVILVCIQGRIARKNGLPIKKAVEGASQSISDCIQELKSLIIELQELSSEELKLYIKDLLERTQKVKIALYNKIIEDGQDAQVLFDSIKQETIEKTESINCSLKEENSIPIDIKNAENVIVESSPVETKKIKKSKRVVVER